MPPPLLQLSDIRSPSAARRCSKAWSCPSRGRAGLPRRPQRLGQIDPAQDRRRAWSSRTAASASSSPAPTVRYLPQEPDLSAASPPRSPMSRRARPGRRSATGPAICWSSSASPARKSPARLSGGEARRAALARVLAPRPRHPAARRAHQPPRPARHRMAGGASSPQQQAALVLISATTGASSNSLSRVTVWLDRGTHPPRSSAASPASRPGATRCWRRRRPPSTSSTARSPREEHWMRYGVTARRKRNVRRVGRAARAAPGSGASTARPPARSRWPPAEARARPAPWSIEAKGVAKAFGDRTIVRGPFAPRHARRPHRHRRPQRQRQDDAASTCSPARWRPTAARSGSAPTSRWRPSTSAATASIPTGRSARR